MVTLVHKMTAAVFLPRDFVLREGLLCASMGFLNRGRVEIVRGAGTAAETAVRLLHENDYWAQGCLIRACPAAASVRAVTYSDVMTLQSEDFYRAISSAGAAVARVRSHASRFGDTVCADATTLASEPRLIALRDRIGADDALFVAGGWRRWQPSPPGSRPHAPSASAFLAAVSGSAERQSVLTWLYSCNTSFAPVSLPAS